ncbi:MAG: hypothetical protein ABFE08_02400 [Armatimonadia bacterium]
MERSRGRCECRLSVCGHRGRCLAPASAQAHEAVVRIASTNEEDEVGDLLVVCPECHRVWLAASAALRSLTSESAEAAATS